MHTRTRTGTNHASMHARAQEHTQARMCTLNTHAYTHTSKRIHTRCNKIFEIQKHVLMALTIITVADELSKLDQLDALNVMINTMLLPFLLTQTSLRAELQLASVGA